MTTPITPAQASDAARLMRDALDNLTRIRGEIAAGSIPRDAERTALLVVAFHAVEHVPALLDRLDQLERATNPPRALAPCNDCGGDDMVAVGICRSCHLVRWTAKE